MSNDNVTELDEVGLDDSIFDDDIDVDDIPDNPNHLPEGTYTCRITKAVLALTKNKDKVGLTIHYQISEGPYSSAFPFTEWLWCPRKPKGPDGKPDKSYEWTPKEVAANSRLKKHFEAVTIGADEQKATKASELVGQYIKVRTANKQDGDMERITIKQVLAVDDGDSKGVPDHDTDY